MKTKKMFCRAAAALAIASMLTSCALPGGGMPPRKKMPELTDSGEDEMLMRNTSAQPSFTNNPYGFNMTLKNMSIGGVEIMGLYISSPDSSMDAVIEAQLNQLKQAESSMVLFTAAWANMYHYGLTLDLSKGSGVKTFRYNYKLESPGLFSIPVVVVADNESASRVIKLQGLFSGFHSISFTYLSDNQGLKNNKSSQKE